METFVIKTSSDKFALLQAISFLTRGLDANGLFDRQIRFKEVANVQEVGNYGLATSKADLVETWRKRSIRMT